MNNFKNPITLLLTLSASSIANAQEAIVELDPVSITASPFDRSSEQIAQPWYALTKEELSRLIQPSLGETIGWQPGISSTSYTTAASRPLIRGHGGSRVRILANGIGTQDISATYPDHSITLDPLLIDQVEILRGPATLLYGGSANGGAVNMVDGRMPKTLITEPGGAFSTGYVGGSSGKYASLKFDVPTGKYVFHFDGSYRDFGNYTTPSFTQEEEHDEDHDDEDHEEEGPVDFVDNSYFDYEDVAVGVSYIGESSRIGFLFNYVKSDFGVLTEDHHHHEEDVDDGDDHGHGNEEEHGRPFTDLTQDRFIFDAEFHLNSDHLDTLSASYVFSDYYHGEYETPTELGIAYDLESHETRWELLHNEIASFSGVLGFQVNIEDMALPSEESSFTNNNITNIDTEKAALFLVKERPLSDALWWELGGRIESTSHEVSGENPTSRDRDFDAFSGSTSIIYDYSESFNLSANFNYSERAPTREELYSNGLHHGTSSYDIGDDALDLEQSIGWDIALKKVAGSVTGELVFFSTDYDGYIYQRSTGNEVNDEGDVVAEDGFTEREYRGVDATFRGVEASLTFPVIEGANQSVHLKAMFDYVRAENGSENEDLPRIPPMRIGTTVQYSHGPLLGTLELRHAFEQDDIAEHETVTPSYTMLNARADYQILEDDTSWNLFAEVRNLTDELAYNSSSFRKAQAPLPGRSFNVGLNYKFQAIRNRKPTSGEKDTPQASSTAEKAGCELKIPGEWIDSALLS